MKKLLYKKISLVYAALVVFLFLGVLVIVINIEINGLNGLFNNSDENISLADGFTIEKYHVDLDVKEDNKIDVTENITINFTSEYKHGIFKFTPFWSQYTGKDGKTIKRKANILNYRSIGEPYSLDTVKDKARIKIGSANEYVGVGSKTYVIKYTYDMGKDPFRNFDELIFHAYGDYWGTEIKNASIRVNMPKSIEGYEVNFFKDKYREKNVNDLVDYRINGNTLYASFNAGKDYEPLTKSLTVDIELPNGYFTGGSWNYGWGSFIISIVIITLTVWTIYKWIKYGKDYEKKSQSIEFYPPDDLSPAEIGYVYNKRQANKKLTISLIVQLASKGYIKIDELKGKKKNIQITNLIADVSKEPVNFEEKLSHLSYLERIVYDRLFESSDVVVISEHKTLYKAFDDVEEKLHKSFKDKVHDKEAAKQIKGSVIRNILILLLSIISYRYVEDLDPSWSILYYLSFICIFINLFFTLFMKRKTEYGELITARVKGFRHFLVTAEKPRLEALVMETPSYFYDILPYTYAMNISKKWIRKFEDIPMPEMDMGTFNYSSDYAYFLMYNDVHYPRPTGSSYRGGSSSSGCSSCGGGGSSYGGGCSSCGGGGSW